MSTFNSMNPWVPQMNERNGSLSKSKIESICNTWIVERMATASIYSHSHRSCFSHIETKNDYILSGFYMNITIFRSRS